MNIFSFSVVCIRAIAMLFLLQIISALPAVFLGISKLPFAKGALIIGIAGVVTRFLFAILILAFTKPLSRFITKGLEQTDCRFEDLKHDRLLSMGWSLMGIYVLLYDVPALVKVVTMGFLQKEGRNIFGNSFEFANTTPQVTGAQILELAFRIAFGIWLLWGAGKIATWLREWRTATPTIETDEWH